MKNLASNPTFLTRITISHTVFALFACFAQSHADFFSKHITKPLQFLQMLLMQISICCICSLNGFSSKSQHPGTQAHGPMSSSSPGVQFPSLCPCSGRDQLKSDGGKPRLLHSKISSGKLNLLGKKRLENIWFCPCSKRFLGNREERGARAEGGEGL